MGGTIRCAKYGCGKRMMAKVCQCGHPVCYVALWYKGRLWSYRKDDAGDPLSYTKAVKLLGALQMQIDAHTFDPTARLDSKLKERRFENKWDIYITEKEEQARRNERSPSYVRILKSYRAKHFAALEGWDVRDIKLEQIAGIGRAIGGKIKTRRNILNALRSFFGWLVVCDGSVLSPPRFPELCGDDGVPRRSLTYAEQQAALARIPEGYRDAIEFGMETGCRVGEVCALKVKDINPDGTIWIRRTWSDYVVRETTKGRRKDIIPLSVQALRLVERQSAAKLPDAYLFCNPHTGTAFRPKTLSGIWVAHSGTDVTLHEATRHSFCSQLVKEGNPLTLVRDLARHSDIRVTAKYVHATDDQARGAVNNRGKVINIEPTRKELRS